LFVKYLHNIKEIVALIVVKLLVYACAQTNLKKYT